MSGITLTRRSPEDRAKYFLSLLIEAAEPFSEEGADLTEARCHWGLCSPVSCVRCSKVIRLRLAIAAAKGE
jgi:hypothetical protein